MRPRFPKKPLGAHGFAPQRHPAPKGPGPPKRSAPARPQKRPGLGALLKNWDPNAPLTGKGLKRELAAATRLEFSPLDRQLQSEQMASQDRSGRVIPVEYADYQKQLATLRGDTQSAYDKVGAQVQGDAAQAGTQDAANRAAIMERLQKDAQLRGTTVDPNIDISGAGAESARRASSSAIYGTIAGQGANQFAYGSNRIGIANKQGMEASETERARGRKIGSDQRELASKKGDFGVDFLHNARDSERKYTLERKATGLDKFKAGETARHNRASEADTRRGQNITRQNSKEGHNVTSAGQRAQNIRDRKNRRQQGKQNAETKRHHKKSEQQAKKGKGGGKL